MMFIHKNVIDDPPTAEHLIQMISAVNGLEKVVFELIAYTGIRTTELLRIRFYDINSNENTIKIYDAKLKRMRTIAVPKSILKKIPKSNGSNNLIFNYTPYKINELLQKSCERVVVGGYYSWHSLHMYFLQSCINFNIPMEVAIENMGVPPNILFKYFKTRIPKYKNKINDLYDKN